MPLHPGNVAGLQTRQPVGEIQSKPAETVWLIQVLGESVLTDEELCRLMRDTVKRQFGMPLGDGDFPDYDDYEVAHCEQPIILQMHSSANVIHQMAAGVQQWAVVPRGCTSCANLMCLLISGCCAATPG